MIKSSILIVEDEVNLGETLKEFLIDEGHQVIWAESMTEALSVQKNHKFDLVIMDIGLPDGNGISLAKALPAGLAILFLSAQNDPETKVTALEAGGLDYMTKPFHLKELKFRLDKMLQGLKKIKDLGDEFHFGPLGVYFKRYELVDAAGAIIPITQKEAEILAMLLSRKGEAIARDEMIEQIWGEDKYPTNRTVDNYIVRLRKWCDSDPGKHIEIQSIRSIGYKLTIKE